MKKIHLSTIAVISHSHVSWHERTNNAFYHWNLSCITLCISLSFVKSCFHSCLLIFFLFGIPYWKIINIYTWVHSSTHLKLHVSKREHTNALWDLRKSPFYRVKWFSSLRQSVVGFSLLWKCAYSHSAWLSLWYSDRQPWPTLFC